MNLDWIILHGLRVLTTCPLLDFWMPRITALGNSGIVWVVAAIVLLCTKKYRRYGVMLLLGLAAALLLGNLALKNLFARPRPCWLDESVPLLIARPSDYSFPSGHTMAGAIGATILTVADRRFGWAAIPLAVLIIYRYTIQGLGYSGLAMFAGVAEMVARAMVGFWFVPLWGYFAACIANPVAWFFACFFLIPAYLAVRRKLQREKDLEAAGTRAQA